MNDAEFDRHAATYHQLHQTNIALTGEEPAYFADYKMRDFRDLLEQAELPLDGRYLDFGSGVGASVVPFREHVPRAQLVCADVSLKASSWANSLMPAPRNTHGCPTASCRWPMPRSMALLPAASFTTFRKSSTRKR